MNEIDAKMAQSLHGISTYHNSFSSGERRFRLKKSDGTAYIRTEAPDVGAWQESHYHNSVMETYIVQDGWVAFAQQVNGRNTLERYFKGASFTTMPRVIHNVYMSANSVIHTVKHGNAVGDDRNTDGTASFDAWCRAFLNEEMIIANSKKHLPEGVDLVKYTEEYRHFDNLIWQTPSWGSAIFALSIGALGAANIDSFSDANNLPRSYVSFSIFLLLALTLLSLSFVNYRFRMHQQSMKRYSSTPFWHSASTIAQFVTNLQAAFLVALSLLAIGFNTFSGVVFSLTFALMLSFAMEARLRQKALALRPKVLIKPDGEI